jgi:hypothetical protein
VETQRRKIFIGSSKEGITKAQVICDLIKTFPGDAECVLWPEIFEPGSLTFEALEEMLMECSAAVFVVTPDDKGEVRGKVVKLPRANIMLEFGLVAGRLGRTNIALCSYGIAELPSDLAGLTVIKMDPGKTSRKKAAEAREPIIHSGEVQLKRWCSRVLPTTERVPRTEIVHGYTGLWRFQLNLNKWRGLTLTDSSFANINGLLTLSIAADGDGGYGMAQARMLFKVTDSSATSNSPKVAAEGEISHAHTSLYSGELQVAHELYSIECRQDASLRLTSRIHCIQPVQVRGRPVPQLEGLLGPPEPWNFEWVLGATGEARALAGSFKTDDGGGYIGRVIAVKVH